MTIVASFASKRCRAPPPSGPKIILRVLNTHLRTEDTFRMCAHTYLKKLMIRYCVKRNLDYDTVRFIYNNRYLRSRQSPAELMMEDFDVIHINMPQLLPAAPNAPA